VSVSASPAISGVARSTWRFALRAAARIIAAFVIYLGTQLAILTITDSPIWAALGGAIVTIPVFWFLGALSPHQGTMHFRRPDRSAWLWAVSLVYIWFSGQILVIWLTNTFPERGADFERHVEQLAATPVTMTLLLTIVLAPVAEELLMRGVLYREIRRGLRIPVWLAVTISSVIFAVMHGNITQIGCTLTLGAFLALAYEYTGLILVPITLHALYNILSTFVPADLIAPLATPALVIGFDTFALAMIVWLCAVCRFSGRR